jgi:uncharacterized phage-associated protein
MEEFTNDKRGHDVRAVANYLLDVAEEKGISIDHMKLQKLIYIAHGWHLARTGRPLVSNAIEAWPYGPVLPDLYHEFKQFGSRPIRGRAFEFDFNQLENVIYRERLPDDTQALIHLVLDVYQNASGAELSELTHQKGTPWEQVAGSKVLQDRRNLSIPNPIIHTHYSELVKQNQ